MGYPVFRPIGLREHSFSNVLRLRFLTKSIRITAEFDMYVASSVLAIHRAELGGSTILGTESMTVHLDNWVTGAFDSPDSILHRSMSGLMLSLLVP